MCLPSQQGKLFALGDRRGQLVSLIISPFITQLCCPHVPSSLFSHSLTLLQCLSSSIFPHKCLSVLRHLLSLPEISFTPLPTIPTQNKYDLKTKQLPPENSQHLLKTNWLPSQIFTLLQWISSPPRVCRFKLMLLLLAELTHLPCAPWLSQPRLAHLAPPVKYANAFICYSVSAWMCGILGNGTSKGLFRVTSWWLWAARWYFGTSRLHCSDLNKFTEPHKCSQINQPCLSLLESDFYLGMSRFVFLNAVSPHYFPPTCRLLTNLVTCITICLSHHHYSPLFHIWSGHLSILLFSPFFFFFFLLCVFVFEYLLILKNKGWK